MSTHPFSETYAEARSKFLSAAESAGAAVQAHLHPERGPDGGVLATDCAWIGPADARSVLVMVSGTHGIEGYCGSGAQIDWLQRGEAAQLGPDRAALLIHALNPYGFAWARRVTHENVDLNRNFVDFARPLPVNRDYDTLAAAVKPADWNEASQTAARLALGAFAQAHGFRAMAQAVSGGQYAHADGLFYGGAAPTWSRITLETLFRERLSRAEEIGIIDYHTGLGPEGYAEPIIAAAPGTPEFDRAIRWHGRAARSHVGGESVSAEIAGDWLAAAPQLAPQARVTGIALEYGTVDANRVLEALMAANGLHAHGDPPGPLARQIKAQIRAAFYVDSDLWRGMVLGQSLCAVRQALGGLGRP